MKSQFIAPANDPGAILLCFFAKNASLSIEVLPLRRLKGGCSVFLQSALIHMFICTLIVIRFHVKSACFTSYSHVSQLKISSHGGLRVIST